MIGKFVSELADRKWSWEDDACRHNHMFQYLKDNLSINQ